MAHLILAPQVCLCLSFYLSDLTQIYDPSYVQSKDIWMIWLVIRNPDGPGSVIYLVNLVRIKKLL